MSDEQKTETGLSTHVNYFTKEVPTGAKLKVGFEYVLLDSYGAEKRVTITHIRKLGDQIMIYFKRYKHSGKLMYLHGTWDFANCSLEAFRAQLLEFGSIDSLDLPYPQQ